MMLAAVRLAEGFMNVEEFLAFLTAADGAAGAEPFAGMALGGILAAAFLGGLAMNLTPCVLPMVPINLMIIGKSAKRGALYGLGIALAYGVMGVLAAVGGLAFGRIQANPYFNIVIAAIFVALGLSLMGVFAIDFSRGRKAGAHREPNGLFAFFMGVVGAVLAGACVAPVLIAVLLLTAKLYAGGNMFALGLPFVLGLGMGAPWPFAGAGLKVLPKPGAWMTKVNKLFGLLVFCFAAWYGYLACTGFRGRTAAPAPAGETAAPAAGVINVASPKELNLDGLRRPILVDCWATWCKNCTAMERKTLKDPRVVDALKGWTVIRLQAEDIDELLALPDFADIHGLPAFVVFE
jgi:thiol:disulfide interchange protein